MAFSILLVVKLMLITLTASSPLQAVSQQGHVVSADDSSIPATNYSSSLGAINSTESATPLNSSELTDSRTWVSSIGDYQVRIDLPTIFTPGWTNRKLLRFVHSLQVNYVNPVLRDWPDTTERLVEDWPYSNYYYASNERFIWLRPVHRSSNLEDTEPMPIAQMEAFTDMLERFAEGRTEGNDEERLSIKIVGTYDRNHVLAAGEIGIKWWNSVSGNNSTTVGVDELVSALATGNFTDVVA